MSFLLYFYKTLRDRLMHLFPTKEPRMRKRNLKETSLEG